MGTLKKKLFIFCTFILTFLSASVNSTKEDCHSSQSIGGGVHLCEKLSNPTLTFSINIRSITPSSSIFGLLLLESDHLYEVDLVLGHLQLPSERKLWYNHRLLFGHTNKLDGCPPVLLYSFDLPKPTENSRLLFFYTPNREYKLWSGQADPEVSPARLHPDFSAAFYHHSPKPIRGYVITGVHSPKSKEKSEPSGYFIYDLALDSLGNVTFQKTGSVNSLLLQRTTSPFELALVPSNSSFAKSSKKQNSLFRTLPASFYHPQKNSLYFFDNHRQCVYIVDNFPAELKKVTEKGVHLLKRFNVPYELFFLCKVDKESKEYRQPKTGYDGRCDRNFIGSPDDDDSLWADPFLWILLWSFLVMAISAGLISFCYFCSGVHSEAEVEERISAQLQHSHKTSSLKRGKKRKWSSADLASNLAKFVSSPKSTSTSKSPTNSIATQTSFSAPPQKLNQEHHPSFSKTDPSSKLNLKTSENTIFSGKSSLLANRGKTKKEALPPQFKNLLPKEMPTVKTPKKIPPPVPPKPKMAPKFDETPAALAKAEEPTAKTPKKIPPPVPPKPKMTPKLNETPAAPAKAEEPTAKTAKKIPPPVPPKPKTFKQLFSAWKKGEDTSSPLPWPVPPPVKARTPQVIVDNVDSGVESKKREIVVQEISSTLEKSEEEGGGGKPGEPEAKQ